MYVLTVGLWRFGRGVILLVFSGGLVVVFVVWVWFADGFVIYCCAKIRVYSVGWLFCI